MDKKTQSLSTNMRPNANTNALFCTKGFVILLFSLMSTVHCQTAKELEALYEILQNPNRYDRRLTPAVSAGQENETTVVNCSLIIRSLWSINYKDMDFRADLYLYQYWIDQRLDHPHFNRIVDLSDPEIINIFWKPDIYFPNSKEGSFQSVAVLNVLFRVYPERGLVMYMIRVTMRFSCNMDLAYYPFDNQTCSMEISTFAKTDKEVELRWSEENPIYLHYKMKELPDYFAGVEHAQCDEQYSIGNYSCLEANILLKRRVGYHLVQDYIPTFLIVVISWVSFWMDVDAVPGRVSLGITTLLTVTAKVTGVQQSLPEVSYVKAIDVWMGICTAFVFCSLCEFILANYRWRSQKKLAARFTLPVTIPSSGKDEELSAVPAPVVPAHLGGSRVDSIARIGFPLAFLLFNIIYWTYYVLV